MKNNMTNNSHRVANKEQSELHISTLDDARTRDSLASLLGVFRSSFGPCGKLQVLRNDVGGPLTVTSASGRLLRHLSVRNTLVRVVTTSVQSHLLRYPDGGLFSGLLSLLLVQNSLTVNIHRRLLCDIYELLLNECALHLGSANFEERVMVDFSSIQRPLLHIKTIMQSKFNSSTLRSSDIDHLARVIVETFLEAHFPDKNSGHVEYVTIEGLPVTDSKLLNGVLYPMPSIPTYSKNPIKVKPNQDGGTITVALISTSMSGDSEELPDATYEVSEGSDIPEVVVDRMCEFIAALVRMRVGMVVCQKVIHPRLKRHLREAGVFFIERLGSAQMDAVQKLIGTQHHEPRRRRRNVTHG